MTIRAHSFNGVEYEMRRRFFFLVTLLRVDGIHTYTYNGRHTTTLLRLSLMIIDMDGG